MSFNKKLEELSGTLAVNSEDLVAIREHCKK